MANGLEMSICQGALASDPTGAGNQMQGLTAWGTAGNTYTSATQTVADTAFNTTGTNGIQQGETAIKNCMSALWKKGCQPDFAYMSPYTKGEVDLFTNNVVKNLYLENKSDQKIVLPAMISVYQSSFGVIRFFFSTAMLDASIVIGNTDQLAIAYLDNAQPKIVPLGIIGDGFGFMGVMEATLEVRDEVSLGLVTKT